MTDQNSVGLVWAIAATSLILFLLWVCALLAFGDGKKATMFIVYILAGTFFAGMCVFFGTVFFLGAAPYAP